MDYLGALRMFVRAVEVGSFSKAAIATNTKTSTVSRAIASLEEDLGVSLFHRTTRRAHLTEPGATFYEHARGVLGGGEEARDAASAMEGRPQGLIRLHVPGAFARLHIMPFVPDFLAAYPDIGLDVSLTDVRVDLLSVGADLAIRIGSLIDSSLLARKPAPRTADWPRRARPIGAARRQSPSRSTCCSTIVWSIRCSRPIVGSFVTRPRQGMLSRKYPSPARCAPTPPSRCAMRRLPAWGSCCCRHGWSARISRRGACGTCVSS